VGFRSGKPFGTAAGSGETVCVDLAQKRIGGGRLSDPRFSRKRHNPALATSRALECTSERVEFAAASNDELSAGWLFAVRRDRAPRHSLHGAREAVPDPGDGRDLLLVCIAQGLAEQGNVAREPCVFDETVGPYGLDQIRLLHHRAGALHEYQQRLEHLRRQRDGHSVAE
jgi:hypothetical protein